MGTIKCISNKTWESIFEKFTAEINIYKEYGNCTPFSYSFNPQTDHVMTNCSSMFDLKKAAAMYFWYKNADPCDNSITEFFDEYKDCIDSKRPYFNSNYGYYAYKLQGINTCINRLLENRYSRHAMFCINNAFAMSELSIDKLCTNTIQFLYSGYRLEMVVQMRSSNMITLLPYDAFMFSVFYMQVYRELIKIYPESIIGNIHMQVASAHCYSSNLIGITDTTEIPDTIIDDFADHNCQLKLEQKLLNALRNE